MAYIQEFHIQQIRQQNPALQVFDRKIIYLLYVPFHIFAIRSGPSACNDVTDQTGQRLITLPVGSFVNAFAVQALKFLHICVDKFRFT